MPIHCCPNAQCAMSGHQSWTVTRVPFSEVEAYRAAAKAQGSIVAIFGPRVTEDDDHIIRGRE